MVHVTPQFTNHAGSSLVYLKLDPIIDHPQKGNRNMNQYESQKTKRRRIGGELPHGKTRWNSPHQDNLPWSSSPGWTAESPGSSSFATSWLFSRSLASVHMSPIHPNKDLGVGKSLANCTNSSPQFSGFYLNPVIPYLKPWFWEELCKLNERYSTDHFSIQSKLLEVVCDQPKYVFSGF